MSRVIDIQNSFTSGELDPKLIARDDVKAYDAGLTTALNVVVLPQGGVKRRPGTKFITELGGSPENGIRLVPFEFNTSDAYLLAFTHNRMAVIKNGVLQTNIAGSGNNYLTTTITSAMLTKMCWVQSADTLIVTQEDMVPKKITRTSDTAWTIANVTFTFNPQHAFTLTIENTSSAGTLTPSGTEGKITLTTQHSYWNASDDIGSFVNVIGSNQFGRAKIVAVDSATVAQALIEIPFFNTDALANADWEHETGYEDTFSGSRGYPRTATFHQGRLFFGGSKSRPSTVWGSKVGLFFDFEPVEGLDDDAVEATLDTNTFNAITDIISGRNLQVFTSGAEFFVPQEGLSPITPTDFFFSTASRNGSKEGIRVKQLESGILFVQRQGKSLSEIAFSDTQLTYLSSKISLLAGHLLKSPTRMDIRRAVATDENDLLLMVNGDDGSMAVFSLLRSQNVIAPSEFTTVGSYIDVGVDITDIYTVVKRADSGSDKYYVEVFDTTFLTDSAVKGTTATSLDMSHIGGATVNVLSDGYVEANQVADAAVTFVNPPATSSEVGLPIALEVKTMPLDLKISSGTRIGFRKRIIEVNALLLKTQNIVINDNPIAIRSLGSGALDTVVPEFTGTKSLHGILGYSNNGQITVTQSAPLKFTLLGLEYKVSVHQGT